MKLSIIIPVYRVEATLDRCLASVTAQMEADWEVILVDDGSPDQCPQLCDEWARRDGRVRVIHKANGGLSDARNTGLDAACGDLIAFADSDDEVAPGTYREAVGALDEATDIVEFPVSRWHGSPRQSLLTFDDAVYDDMAGYWLSGHAYEHTYAWNKVYRRELFADARFPVGRVFEDVWTLPLLLARTRRVKTIGRGLYLYHDNPQGITATAQGRQLLDLLEAHLQVLPRWADDRYFMHVLNIQLDVCRLTGQPPQLPPRRVSPTVPGLTMSQRLKALVLRTMGLPTLVRLHLSTH